LRRCSLAVRAHRSFSATRSGGISKAIGVRAKQRVARLALRLVEAFVTAEDRAAAAEAIGPDAIAIWYEPLAGDRLLVRALVQSAQVEGATDRLKERFPDREEFRVVVVPVEAAIPAPPAPEEKPETEETARQAAEARARVSRDELYQDVSESAALDATYLVMVGLSALVAALGLINNSTAVVIGAMMIAPLLGPNLALSLGTALGDAKLAARAVRANLAGLGLAFAESVVIGFAFPADPFLHLDVARLGAHPGEVILALASGCAGALAFTTGAPAALIGVMVAVALLPPLVTAGLLLGSGNLELAVGPFQLTLVNVICVNLAGVITFVVQGIRPHRWWEADRARRAVRVAIVLWTVTLILLLAVALTLQASK
jgi:uncharacterized hydrophobic protein (TIGR00341 family)